MSEPFVRLYEPGDEAPIRALFAEAFGADRTVEEWRWWHFDRPGTPPYIRVLVDGDHGDVIGHLSNVYFPTYFGGAVGEASQGSDLMVRRDHRGRGLRPLLSAYVDHQAPYDVKLSFPIDDVVEGFRSREPDAVFPGRLTQWVRWADIGAMSGESRRVPAPVRVVGDVGLRVVRAAVAVGGSKIQVVEVDASDDGFDALARRSAGYAAAIRCRGADYLRWRWIDSPRGRWRVWAARSADGALLGWIVAGWLHTDADDRARVVDVLADSPQATTALLLHAARAMHAARRATVTFEYQDARPWARRACYRAGFLPRGEGPNIAFRQLSARARAAVFDAAGWYLTAGDTDLV
jgi:GNAT superfamily N-acetyltransferase